MSNSHGMYFGSAVVGLIVVAVLIGVIYALTVGSFPPVTATAGGGDARVAERLRPIGQVRVADQTQATAEAPTPAAAPASAASAGEATYSKVCFACHTAGVAGAPKLGDKAAWEPRIAQGMDVLLHTAINGKGAMPPRGTCAACSDDDLKAVIEFMVSKVQ